MEEPERELLARYRAGDAGALGELVTEGKVRHIGLSNETPYGVMQFLNAAERGGLPRVASIQNAYNLSNRVFEAGLAEMAIEDPSCGGNPIPLSVESITDLLERSV